MSGVHIQAERPPATNAMLADLTERFSLEDDSIHGPSHWLRVLLNGRLLARQTGADPVVVDLFALIHDVCRQNEDHDPDHGARSGRLAGELNGLWFDLSGRQLALLQDACTRHDRGETQANITVQTCWDADRLDLKRVGITPDPARLCTQPAREADFIAAASSRSCEPSAGKLAKFPGTEKPLTSFDFPLLQKTTTRDPQALYDWAHQLSLENPHRYYEKALKFFGYAASAGHPRAQWRWGQMVAAATGAKQNKQRAVVAFEDAARAGLVEAKNSLGAYLAMGWGVPRDINRGVGLVRKAADAGLASAHYNLGQFQLNADLLAPDEYSALDHFRAAMPLPDAAFNLAVSLLNKPSSPEHVREGLAALTSAARMGLPEAQYSLGVTYHYGELVARDTRRFRFWIRRAAKNGHAGAEAIIETYPF